MRIILLVDMDYFFAACEELRNPNIKNKPVVVGSDPKNGSGRGIVSTANYIARKYGIRSGMPISIAYRLKPDAIYLRVDDRYYEEISNRLMEYMRGFADKFEQVSIDEAFLDMSDRVKNYEEAYVYAKGIKDSITSKFGLPCSVGIGTNKLIAKMACEASKPNGIKLVKEEESKGFLAPMPLEKLYGVGKKSAEKLKRLGLSTIGDLAHANKQMLIDEFGVFGLELYKHANCIDSDKVIENYETKSIGREHTFEYDTNSFEEVKKTIEELAQEIVEEAKKQGFLFKIVTLKIRNEKFEEHLHSKNLGYYIQEIDKLNNIASKLLEENMYGEKIRKIGLRISGLAKSLGQMKLESYF
ncbi:MAG: DNA polymerase IV [Candidatus Micrarchaeia archaeon]